MGHQGDAETNPLAGFPRRNDYGGCDESKCVSRGRSDQYNGSFTCYGDDDGGFFPQICADGFLPLVVEEEDSFGTEKDHDSMRYFTCCPPQHYEDGFLMDSRHCSDPVGINRGTKGTLGELCQDKPVQNHVRWMKPREEEERESFYLCCDETVEDEPSNSTASSEDSATPLHFLDAADCVPYHNEYYDASEVKNQLGRIGVIGCDFPGGDFVVPRPLPPSDSINSAASRGRYQCCRNGSSLAPFVQDDVFWMTVYPPLVLYCVATVFAAIIFSGLLIPLIVQLINGTFQKNQRASFSLQRSMAASSQRSIRSMRAGGASSTTGTPEASYSTYNLYIVYLAFPDLVAYLYGITMAVSITQQHFNPKYFSFLVSPIKFSAAAQQQSIEQLVGGSYVIANLWINAIVAYQVLVLFRSSQRAQRVKQPGLKRVNLQAGAVYLLSGLHFGMNYGLNHVARSGNYDIDASQRSLILGIALTWNSLLSLLPIGYVVGVAVLVWKRGYIPPLRGIAPRDRARRELALYFFRIIAVFIGVWIPGIVLFYYYGVSSDPRALLAMACAGPVQGILTFVMVLTKSDVRRHVWDLLTLSYLLGPARGQCVPRKSSAKARDPTSTEFQQTSSKFFIDSSQRNWSRASLDAEIEEVDDSCETPKRAPDQNPHRKGIDGENPMACNDTYADCIQINFDDGADGYSINDDAIEISHPEMDEP